MFVEPNDAKRKSILSNSVTTLNLFRVYGECDAFVVNFYKATHIENVKHRLLNL